MKYRYSTRRANRRLARKSQRNFIITLIIIGVLIYSTLVWVLPSFIGIVGYVKNIMNPPQKIAAQPSETGILSPPVFNIPFEATNSAQIDIRGFATPNSKVRLYIDDKQKDTIDVSGEGSFIFQNVDLSLGTNNIYGKTLDENSKESLPSKTIKLLYLNEKPKLNVSEPDDNKKIQGGDKKVKVTGKTDPGVKVFITGTQTIVDQNGNFSTDFALNDGDNSISIKAVDPASNTTEIQRNVIFQP